jgi:branched-chain amino acid transport system substrate-binding protein
MKYFKMFSCLMALVVAALLLCSNAGAKDNEIVIGFSGPLSGPAAEYGQDCVNGLDMAIKELNTAGGIKVKGKQYKFRLVKLDDRIDPTQAVLNARRMQEQDKAVAIFQPVTGIAYAMMSVNQEKGHEFLMMAYSSSPSTSKMNNKLTIVVPPTFSVYAQVFSQWAWDKGYRRAAVILTNEIYGDEWTDFFKKFWTKQGGTVTAVKPANYYTETDFSPHISAVLATKPDVMLIGGPSATTALVIEQSRSMGFKGGFVLIDQAKLDWITATLKGSELIGDTVAVAAVAAIPGPITPRFNKTYAKDYGKMITWENGLHYGAVKAIANAIVAAGTTDDIYAIRKAFPKAYPLLGDQTPAEVYGLTDDGRQQMLASVQTVDKGKLSPAILYCWWAKDQKEFDRVKKLSKFDKSRIKWLKTYDY